MILRIGSRDDWYNADSMHRAPAKFVEPLGQIIQRAGTGRLVFVDPTLGNLFQRRRVEIMQFFPPPPKRNNQVGFDQQTEMFGNALTGHAEVLAKLVQGLAVALMELIEQGAPVWVGQGFKDIVHAETDMQPTGCISFQSSQGYDYHLATADRDRTPWRDQFFR